MNAKPTLRAGIVGAGFAAAFHVEALRKVYSVNVEFAGVYSPRRARDFAAARGLPVADSLDDLIAHSDVLHVCSTVDTHEPLAIRILQAGKFAIVEKPLTGMCSASAEAMPIGADPFTPPEDAGCLQSIRRIIDAERASRGRILYAENWVYAPAIQKEREIIEKTGAQILWMHGEQGHSGSHAKTYGQWRVSGGGAMLSKGCHPLTAALYLKVAEGRAHGGRPIQPATVSARTHAITRLPAYRDAGHLRTDYEDIEDFAMIHVTFEDGTVASIFASDLIMGGVHNWLEVAANNHRTCCQINPNNAMQTFNPAEAIFSEVYTVEKAGTRQGWSFTSPDEPWFGGVQQEIEAFYRAAAFGEPVASDSLLAANSISTLFSAYLSANRAGAAVAVKTFLKEKTQ